jgi:hypothetical protein
VAKVAPVGLGVMEETGVMEGEVEMAVMAEMVVMGLFLLAG